MDNTTMTTSSSATTTSNHSAQDHNEDFFSSSNSTSNFNSNDSASSNDSKISLVKSNGVIVVANNCTTKNKNNNKDSNGYSDSGDGVNNDSDNDNGDDDYGRGARFSFFPKNIITRFLPFNFFGNFHDDDEQQEEEKNKSDTNDGTKTDDIDDHDNKINKDLDTYSSTRSKRTNKGNKDDCYDNNAITSNSSTMTTVSKWGSAIQSDPNETAGLKQGQQTTHCFRCFYNKEDNDQDDGNSFLLDQSTLTTTTSLFQQQRSWEENIGERNRMITTMENSADKMDIVTMNQRRRSDKQDVHADLLEKVKQSTKHDFLRTPPNTMIPPQTQQYPLVASILDKNQQSRFVTPLATSSTSLFIANNTKQNSLHSEKDKQNGEKGLDRPIESCLTVPPDVINGGRDDAFPTCLWINKTLMKQKDRNNLSTCTHDSGILNDEIAGQSPQRQVVYHHTKNISKNYDYCHDDSQKSDHDNIIHDRESTVLHCRDPRQERRGEKGEQRPLDILHQRPSLPAARLRKDIDEQNIDDHHNDNNMKEKNYAGRGGVVDTTKNILLHKQFRPVLGEQDRNFSHNHRNRINKNTSECLKYQSNCEASNATITTSLCKPYVRAFNIHGYKTRSLLQRIRKPSRKWRNYLFIAEETDYLSTDGCYGSEDKKEDDTVYNVAAHDITTPRPKRMMIPISSTNIGLLKKRRKLSSSRTEHDQITTTSLLFHQQKHRSTRKDDGKNIAFPPLSQENIFNKKGENGMVRSCSSEQQQNGSRSNLLQPHNILMATAPSGGDGRHSKLETTYPNGRQQNLLASVSHPHIAPDPNTDDDTTSTENEFQHDTSPTSNDSKKNRAILRKIRSDLKAQFDLHGMDWNSRSSSSPDKNDLSSRYEDDDDNAENNSSFDEEGWNHIATV